MTTDVINPQTFLICSTIDVWKLKLQHSQESAPCKPWLTSNGFVDLSRCEHFINCNKKSNVSYRNTTSQIMIYRNKCPCNFCYLCSWNPVLSCKCQSAKCKTCLYLTSFGLLVLSNCEMIYNIKSTENFTLIVQR